jgi:phosphoesterase RecJ-like protein
MTEIDSSEKIALVSHLNPDGDALGSSIAFYLALRKLKKDVTLVNMTKEIAIKYDFLPSFKKIKNSLAKNIDLVIAFDCGSFNRLGIERGDFKIVNIDHHVSNEYYGDINIVDSTKASTSVIVYEILKELNIDMDKEMANAIYLALAEDTNFFSDATTTKEVFRLAYELTDLGANPEEIGRNSKYRESLAKIRLDALFIDTVTLKRDAKIAIGYVDEEMLKKSGALRYDTAHLADILISLATVKVGIYYIEMPEGIVKFSLRGKGVEVDATAKKFGGGGHRFSAGFSIDKKDKDLVLEKLINEVEL